MERRNQGGLMAAESGADVHHGAPHCLLRLFEAAAPGLADWSEFHAEAERWGIEDCWLSRQGLRALSVLLPASRRRPRCPSRKSWSTAPTKTFICSWSYAATSGATAHRASADPTGTSSSTREVSARSSTSLLGSLLLSCRASRPVSGTSAFHMPISKG